MMMSSSTSSRRRCRRRPPRPRRPIAPQAHAPSPAQQRDYYGLEKFWHAAESIDLSDVLGPNMAPGRDEWEEAADEEAAEEGAWLLGDDDDWTLDDVDWSLPEAALAAPEEAAEEVAEEEEDDDDDEEDDDEDERGRAHQAARLGF